ncbi:YajG family lipoprotein [Falsiroseomonas ponticola]|uniref:YajG family lipoprotein n=1 Tax=Falsiroseomonas ponticola TaxID=2786951 RepID=UPI0019333B9B|nr:YajG family lipoprotein [Roseomonas ponticola]
MRRLLTLLALLPLAACALEPDYIHVRHTPVAGVQAIPGAERIGLQVETRDARTANRDRVSVKKNGYGMEMAPIIATNDVIAETRQAVIGEFEARGFRIGGTDGRVEVEVLRFHSEFRAGFWSGVAAADLQVNVKITDPTGRIVFTRTFTAEGLNPNIQIASGENARIALEAGLQRLIRQIGDDPDLARALMALAPPAPVPAPTAGRRPIS